MLASTIITRVRRQLVETVGAFWSDAELLDLINKGEADFHNEVRTLESKAFLSTVAGRADYPLPANWLSARALFYNNPDEAGNDAWSRLEPTNLEKQAQENPNFLSSATESRGTPQRYWIWDRTIYLDPAPETDGDSNVYMFFKSKPVALISASQDLNTDDSLADGIEAYVLKEAWAKEKEPDLADREALRYTDYVRKGRRYSKKQSGDQKYRMDIESGTPFGTTSGWVFPPTA